MTVDRTIHSIGLPRHPKPDVIANNLDHLATALRRDAQKAITAAGVLAARGWPTGTLGDGGGRSGATMVVVNEQGDLERIQVTSTEAAALHHDRWANADQRLAKLLRLIWTSTVQLEQLMADLLAHADDVDELPAGTGACEACSKVVRPDAQHPDRRLRAGLCNACRMHWERSGITDRHDWLLARRAMLRHREGAEALANRFAAAVESGQVGHTG